MPAKMALQSRQEFVLADELDAKRSQGLEVPVQTRPQGRCCVPAPKNLPTGTVRLGPVAHGYHRLASQQATDHQSGQQIIQQAERQPPGQIHG